jgi:rfaE bifunctional protein kinase chain/domain
MQELSHSTRQGKQQHQPVVSLSGDSKMIAAQIRMLVPEGKRIAFVSGNFNVVHPGHFRLLNFASECADFLIVGVNNDETPGAMIPEALRLESIRAIGCVDFAFLLTESPEEFITNMKPDIVVKGKEHEQHLNLEESIVESYGGKLLFSSGEMRFSSLDLLRRELHEVIFSTIRKPVDYIKRHALSNRRLHDIVRRFTELSVVVIGDLIVDEYVMCEPLGLSREDPTIVVTPIQRDIFVGAAGIVAAHAKSLGAHVNYIGIIGDDETANFAEEKLAEYGVDNYLVMDKSRPTTLKQRFRAGNKTLLRVSHLRHHDISHALCEKILNKLARIIKDTDMLIFSDFNYGCLPQQLVDDIIALCNQHDVPMVADSQSSSQIGDISRFKGMLLVTPTEHEARLAVRDQSSGLTILADALYQKAEAKHVFVTLGAEGVLVYSPENTENGLTTDQLPAFNTAPKDVSGGGECLLICASLALAVGATVWESAYLGSLAAACHVGRIGNSPLSINEVLQEIIV